MLGQRNGNSSFEILKVTQRVEVESRCSIGMEAGEIIIMIDRARKKIIFFFFSVPSFPTMIEIDVSPN